jgi:hypothetical protein
VNLLEQFADRHPLATGAYGTIGALTAALCKALHVIAGVAADVGMIAGAAAGVLSFFLVYRRWRERARQNELHERRAQFPDDDFQY